MTPRSLYRSVLVTGGGGMLAHAFGHVLRERGAEPRLVDRKSADVTDAEAMRRLFDAARPTLVLNCAAYTKVDQAEQEEPLAIGVNGMAVETLAKLCRQHDAALVHYSTDFVFDGKGRRPYRPDDATNPLGAYGRSKRFGEKILEASGPPRWLLVRTAWLYGPGGPCFPQTMINAAKAGKPLRVVDDQVGSPTYTFDLAEATLGLLDRGAGGIWHVTNSGSVSWYGLTRKLYALRGVATPVVPVTTEEFVRPAPRPRYSVLTTIQQPRIVLPPWEDALAEFCRALDA